MKRITIKGTLTLLALAFAGVAGAGDLYLKKAGTWDATALLWATTSGGTADTAYIDGSDIKFAQSGTLKMDADFFANSIEVIKTSDGLPLELNGKTLTVAGDVTRAKGMTLALNGPGTLKANSIILDTASNWLRINKGVTLDLAEGVLLRNGTITLNTQTVDVPVTVTGSGSIQTQTAPGEWTGKITVVAGGCFSTLGSASITFGDVDVAGELVLNNKNATFGNVTLTDGGVMTWGENGCKQIASMTIGNGSTLDLTARTMALSGLTLAGGATLKLPSNATALTLTSAATVTDADADHPVVVDIAWGDTVVSGTYTLISGYGDTTPNGLFALKQVPDGMTAEFLVAENNLTLVLTAAGAARHLKSQKDGIWGGANATPWTIFGSDEPANWKDGDVAYIVGGMKLGVDVAPAELHFVNEGHATFDLNGKALTVAGEFASAVDTKYNTAITGPGTLTAERITVDAGKGIIRFNGSASGALTFGEGCGPVEFKSGQITVNSAQKKVPLPLNVTGADCSLVPQSGSPTWEGKVTIAEGAGLSLDAGSYSMTLNEIEVAGTLAIKNPAKNTIGKLTLKQGGALAYEGVLGNVGELVLYGGATLSLSPTHTITATTYTFVDVTDTDLVRIDLAETQAEPDTPYLLLPGYTGSADNFEFVGATDPSLRGAFAVTPEGLTVTVQTKASETLYWTKDSGKVWSHQEAVWATAESGEPSAIATRVDELICGAVDNYTISVPASFASKKLTFKNGINTGYAITIGTGATLSADEIEINGSGTFRPQGSGLLSAGGGGGHPERQRDVQDRHRLRFRGRHLRRRQVGAPAGDEQDVFADRAHHGERRCHAHADGGEGRHGLERRRHRRGGRYVHADPPDVHGQRHGLGRGHVRLSVRVQRRADEAGRDDRRKRH